MATTPGDIVNLALLDSGVIGQGQSASSEDTNNALTRLNFMLAQWNRKRWLVYNLVDTLIPSTGAVFYTVGVGGDFNIGRPDKLEDGNYLRQGTAGTEDETLETFGGNDLETTDDDSLFVAPGSPSGIQPVDYPMTLLQSHEDYNRIRIKYMGTFPQYVWYDAAYPYGKVYFWPVPQANTYSLSILTKAQISIFSSLGQPILLPEVYEAALLYNLQVRLRLAYRLPVDEGIVMLAKDALNTIRQSNTQIPTRRLPGVVTNRAGWSYNVFSDSN